MDLNNYTHRHKLHSPINAINATEINNISVCDLSGITDGQILKYNETNGCFEAADDNVTPSSFDVFLEFQEDTSVAASTTTTILDFTNSTGASIYINSVWGEGNSRGEWGVYIEDVLTAKIRSSVSDLNVYMPMYEFALSNTENIKVKVTHYDTGNSEFSSTINYHD